MIRTKRFWIVGVAVIILVPGALSAKIFQTEIGMWLLQRGVEKNVGRDLVTSLPDGLHVALCGTGSPLPNPDRSGPCTVVIAGKQIFVVDAGEGGARNIARMGIPNGQIRALLLTHFHSDHIDGMGPMMLLRWTGNANTRPLPVYGPPGVESVVAGFDTAYSADYGYRVAHHGSDIVPPTGAGAIAHSFAMPPQAVGKSEEIYQSEGLIVSAFRVNHDPVKPAVGYRFDYRGRSVVLSGDTAPSPNLIAVAKGADLLVHEALQPRLVDILVKGLDAKHKPKTAQIMRDIQNYHSSPEQAADAARKAGVRELVLSHIVPPLPSSYFYAAFLGDAATHYSGPIIVGEDGMFFSLPVKNKDIQQSRAF